MSIHPNQDQFSLGNNDRAVRTCAAVQKFYFDHGADPYALSRYASGSNVLGRPTLIVPLDYLPYEPDLPNGYVSENKAKEHEIILRSVADNLPLEYRFSEEWNWSETSQRAIVNSFCNRETGFALGPIKNAPSCLAGTYYTKEAVIILANRFRPLKQSWAANCALLDDMIEAWPAHQTTGHTIGHEIGHVMQRGRSEHIANDVLMRETERNADAISFQGLELIACEGTLNEAERSREIIEGMLHSRALSGFIETPPIYWFAHDLRNRTDINFHRALFAGYYLRFLANNKLHGKKWSTSPKAIHKIIYDWYLESQVRNIVTKWQADPSPDTRKYKKDIQYQISSWPHHPLAQRLHPVLTASGDNSLNRIEFELRRYQNSLDIKPWDFDDINMRFLDEHYKDAVVILSKALNNGEITDLLACENARLIINGMRHFCPSMTDRLRLNDYIKNEATPSIAETTWRAPKRSLTRHSPSATAGFPQNAVSAGSQSTLALRR